MIVSPPIELPPGTRVGDFVLEGRVGRGGMSTIYAALHPMIGKRAAIKILDDSRAHDDIMVDRLTREARAVNRIRHPNVVDIFGFGQLPDGRHYLVMELLDGEPLARRLGRFRFANAEVYEILIQISDALDAAHAQGIAHLDLKPDNLFLSPVRGGRTWVKVLDFGLAERVDAKPIAIVGAIDHHPAFRGTPEYASPEQAQCVATVDQRSDIYSLGVVAFQMFVGRRPFAGDTVMEILLKQIGEAPPRPRSLNDTITAEAEQLVLEMLEKQPERRPTAAEVRERLVAIEAAGLRAATQSMPRVAGPAPR